MSKVYRTRRGPVTALEKTDLEVEAGEFVAVRGPSGSGKTTLLLAAGGMLRPTSGRVEAEGRDLYGMSAAERARFRRDRLGFVFQLYHLVPYLSTLHNVRLSPGGSRGGAEKGKGKDGRARAAELLEELGLAHRVHHRPGELSAGERQRVALARALYRRPALLLADEPTGNLDPENRKIVLDRMAAFRAAGGTVLVVTHGDDVEATADRTVVLEK